MQGLQQGVTFGLSAHFANFCQNSNCLMKYVFLPLKFPHGVVGGKSITAPHLVPDT